MVDEDDREALGAGATALVQSVAAVAAPALFGPLAAAMVQSVAGSPLASLSTFLVGRDRETRESKSQRLLVAFVDNFAATIEFPGEESPEVAARKALEHASDEDVDALIRAVKEAMDAVCYEALPYLAKLMADRLRQPGKDRRFFRDVCRLLCDVDRRELREVWSIATAVDEIRDKTSALPTEQKPFEYNIFMERGPRLRVLTGGQDAHVPLEAHAELATSVGRDALARNGLVRHVSNGDGGWETGTAGTMEGLATLFRAVGSPG